MLATPKEEEEEEEEEEEDDEEEEEEDEEDDDSPSSGRSFAPTADFPPTRSNAVMLAAMASRSASSSSRPPLNEAQDEASSRASVISKKGRLSQLSTHNQ